MGEGRRPATGSPPLQVVAAAAQLWGVAPATLKTGSGKVSDPASGKSISYAALAAAAPAQLLTTDAGVLSPALIAARDEAGSAAPIFLKVAPDLEDAYLWLLHRSGTPS